MPRALYDPSVEFQFVTRLDQRGQAVLPRGNRLSLLFLGAPHDIDNAGGAVFIGGDAVDVVFPEAAVDLAAAVI